ncbi:recombination regulator RecX [Lactobacillus sp. ESL0731]|uniref:recombination regulator RecX n=1 Tax=unclassified Lactobacillus TaxID=2620435 RepID=UPI0023F7EE6A|nr:MULTISPECIES: recombination regulator RecX [unclassified Lactobacillus]WEV51710.1 recombination regulator RecX [Lactobacillus sp. ESL0700]WEV62839.1 recombination regulator RecX [Lactobacillus sp. ESL0731]
MPIITKVSSQKRPGRYNIFLDGQYAFSASEQTVAEFMLLKGQELTPDELAAVKKFDVSSKATALASNYLSYQARTVYEVLQYLQKHGIEDEAAQNAVSQLSAMGFLDDRKYVTLSIKQSLRSGTDGPLTLTRKLTQKGIDPAIIQEELAEVADEDWLDTGLRVLKSLKSQVGKVSERELNRKMNSKLLSHGFSSGIVSLVVAEADMKPDTDAQVEALKKQGVKAYKRFRRLPESERERKIRNYLFTHGFASNEIDAFLAGEIIPLDELAEY